MVEVRLQRLTKVYPGNVSAIRGLDLTVRAGELLVIMGPSGCGKTTTLRLVAGLESPTAGEIWIDGKRVTNWPPRHRNVAMTFQKPALYPHLTVEQNLAFGNRLRRRVDSKHLSEVIGDLRLESLTTRRPFELSGGQQQRVALGRAIIQRPHVFLLDEPLSNLDGPLRIELRRQLHLLHERLRATMIYVTHDQAEAMALGERVAVLEAGVLQQVDSPVGLYSRPANRCVAVRTGMLGMNLLDGEVSGTGTEWWFGRGSRRLPLPLDVGARWSAFRGQPLTLGIRPENVNVGEIREGEVSMNAWVALVEALGDYSLVSLRNEEWTLTASLRGPRPPWLAENATVAVGLAVAKAHVFDGVTGMATCHPETG